VLKAVTDLGSTVHVCAITQQQFNHFNTILLAGDMQRSETVLSHIIQHTHHTYNTTAEGAGLFTNHVMFVYMLTIVVPHVHCENKVR